MSTVRSKWLAVFLSGALAVGIFDLSKAASPEREQIIRTRSDYTPPSVKRPFNSRPDLDDSVVADRRAAINATLQDWAIVADHIMRNLTPLPANPAP